MRLAPTFAALAVLASSSFAPGCGSPEAPARDRQREPAAGEDALSIVARSAAREPTLGRRFARATSGYAAAAGELRSTRPMGAKLPTIASHLPARAGEAWRLAVDDRVELSITLTADAAAPAMPSVASGRAIYRGAHASTDVVHLHDGFGAESLYVLHDDAAPSRFSFRVARGAAIAGARSDHEGGIAFVDAAGRARLVVERPFAVDANGIRRAATLDLTGDTLSIELDRSGLAFPIVLDPYVGTSRWSLVPVDPTQRHGCSLAEAGGELALFGGKSGLRLDDTWTWDGNAWTAQSSAPHPGPRTATSMASLGTKAILFGGVDEKGNPIDETWSFDGAAWTRLSPAHSPGARAFATMTSLGGRVVLFGGQDSPTSDLIDTWIFDGTDWRQLSTADTPIVGTGQLGAAMASVGGVAYLVSVDTGQTWRFDGTAWTDLSSTANTPMPSGPNDGLLGLGVAGGQLTLATTYGTFQLVGDVWKAKPTAHQPVWRSDDCASAFGDALAIFGGSSQGGELRDFWTFDGTDWREPISHSAPSPRADAHLAALDDRLVLFGGLDAKGDYTLDDTWEFDGAKWTAKSTSIAPNDAAQVAMANAGATVLLHDGTDTWSWDHARWTRHGPAHTPNDYEFGTLVRVGTSNVLVTTSDVASDTQTIETWSWSGTDWSQGDGAHGPSTFGMFTSFAGAGLYVDPEAGRQWSWDGSAWTEASSAPPFGKLFVTFPSGQSAAVDVGRFALLLGDAPGWTANRAWLWDGTSWGQLAIEGLPRRSELAAASVGTKVYAFGGGDANGTLTSDTYALDLTFSNGAACMADAECDSAVCSQGVCCNERCDGNTRSCALAGTRGTCAPVLATCVDATTLQAADGTKKSCAPYVCAAAACPTSCASSADCVGGYLCDSTSQTCVAATPGGSASSSGCAIERVSSPTRIGALSAALAWLLVRRRRRRA